MRAKGIVSLILVLAALAGVAWAGQAIEAPGPQGGCGRSDTSTAEFRGRAGLVLAPRRPGMDAGPDQYAARPRRPALYRIAGQPGASDRRPRLRARLGEYPGRPREPRAGLPPVQGDRRATPPSTCARSSPGTPWRWTRRTRRSPSSIRVTTAWTSTGERTSFITRRAGRAIVTPAGGERRRYRGERGGGGRGRGRSAGELLSSRPSSMIGTSGTMPAPMPSSMP